MVRNGPNGYTTPPTSGNAWARRFLESMLAMPQGPLKSGAADGYLSMLAPLFGRIRRLATPQDAYRTRGLNQYWGRTVERLPEVLAVYDRVGAALPGAGHRHHLRATAHCVLRNERLVVFDLASGPGGGLEV